MAEGRGRGRPRKVDSASVLKPIEKPTPKPTRGRGRPKKPDVMPALPAANFACASCKKIKNISDFYNSKSILFNGKVTYCKSCIKELYDKFVDKYMKENRDNPEKDAIRRMCMVLDVYYSDKILESAMKDFQSDKKTAAKSLMISYMKMSQLSQSGSKTYDDTINDEGTAFVEFASELDKESITEETVRFFGSGFSNEDYKFLQEQYADWTDRHECNTKAQEEIFKRICFVQLDLLKADRANQDTKDLVATFQKLLDSAKLQPKQNKSKLEAEDNTFGTLIDKWENTRPVPDVDPELADVDKIGLYQDVFFKGHLAKMMGLKNGITEIYRKFIKKYSVEKPQYDDEDDTEAIFDAIFGNQSMDD